MNSETLKRLNNPIFEYLVKRLNEELNDGKMEEINDL